MTCPTRADQPTRPANALSHSAIRSRRRAPSRRSMRPSPAHLPPPPCPGRLGVSCTPKNSPCCTLILSTSPRSRAMEMSSEMLSATPGGATEGGVDQREAWSCDRPPGATVRKIGRFGEPCSRMFRFSGWRRRRAGRAARRHFTIKRSGQEVFEGRGAPGASLPSPRERFRRRLTRRRPVKGGGSEGTA